MKRKVITGSIVILLLSIFLLIPGCDDFNLVDLLSNYIAIIPEEVTLISGETIDFEVSAGIAPFVFTEVGDGIIPNGIYTAPGIDNTYIISVEDDCNRTAAAYATVVNPLNIVTLAPEIVSTVINGVIQFTISGGTGDYTVTMDPGLGFDDHPGDGTLLFNYTADATAGFDIIRVTDSKNQIAEAYVTITSISGLQISPTTAEILPGGSFTFSASGGTPYLVPPSAAPYVFSIIDDIDENDSINQDNGKYIAPTAPFTGTRTVVVKDSLLASSTATVYVVTELLTINPSVALTLYVGDEFAFTASNGESPYTFSILGNESSGSVNSSTGLFTALAKDNNVTVVVEDSRGATDTCRVKIKN